MDDNKKVFKCTACGKDVVATKFASAKTIRCDECKKSNKPIDNEIVISILGQTKPKESVSTGSTKILPCTRCGKDTEVTKFASAAKVLCDECKGISKPTSDGNTGFKIDLKKLVNMPTIEEYHVIPSIIANPRLRNISCPACHHEYMRIINIIDYSAIGLIIHYQCSECSLLVSVSEQTDHQITTQKGGALYDYSGNVIENTMLSAKESTRANTTIRILMDKLKENNIQINGIDLPPYTRQEERPVPVGFVIPEEDVWIKTIQDTINYISSLSQSSSESITASLKHLLKGQ